MSTESKTVLRAAAAPDLVRMQEANRMCAHCWFVSPRLDLCISMSVVLNTGHMCLVLLCVCVRMCVWRVPWGVWYYPAWCAPGSASITASNASPGEHDITHTYTRSHRGDPHWAKFPLAPPARQRLYIYLYVCVWVCVSTVCQPIESMLSPESLSAGAPAAANQPASQSKCLICSLSVDRPITGRISQEGPATWVRTVALATSIIILEAGEGEKDFFLLFFNKSAKKGGYILWIFRSDTTQIKKIFQSRNFMRFLSPTFFKHSSARLKQGCVTRCFQIVLSYQFIHRWRVQRGLHPLSGTLLMTSWMHHCENMK